MLYTTGAFIVQKFFAIQKTAIEDLHDMLHVIWDRMISKFKFLTNNKIELNVMYYNF